MVARPVWSEHKRSRRMARRAQCRCGSWLSAPRGANDYKTQCPRCRANVRLQPMKSPVVRPRKANTMRCTCGTVIVLEMGTDACPCCGRTLAAPPAFAVPTPAEALLSHGPGRVLDLFEESRPRTAPPPPEPLAREEPCSRCGEQIDAHSARCQWCGASRASLRTEVLLEKPRVWPAAPSAERPVECGLVRRVLNAGANPFQTAYRWLLRKQPAGARNEFTSG